MTVTAGDMTVTAGDMTVTAGNVTAGDVAVGVDSGGVVTGSGSGHGWWVQSSLILCLHSCWRYILRLVEHGQVLTSSCLITG